MELTAGYRRHLERSGRRWEYGTTAWNSLEAFVAIGSGLAAHSLGLIAFGLDSCVEVFASVVVLWHLAGENEAENPQRGQRAMRLIGVSFAVLGVYLIGSAVHGFVARSKPDASPIGAAFMAATVVVMFVLAWGKRRTGKALESGPLIANAAMTLLDGFLAAAIFVSLLLNSALGWWWMDPLAAAVVAVVALNEAREALT